MRFSTLILPNRENDKMQSINRFSFDDNEKNTKKEFVYLDNIYTIVPIPTRTPSRQTKEEKNTHHQILYRISGKTSYI